MITRLSSPVRPDVAESNSAQQSCSNSTIAGHRRTVQTTNQHRACPTKKVAGTRQHSRISGSSCRRKIRTWPLFFTENGAGHSLSCLKQIQPWPENESTRDSPLLIVSLATDRRRGLAALTRTYSRQRKTQQQQAPYELQRIQKGTTKDEQSGVGLT